MNVSGISNEELAWMKFFPHEPGRLYLTQEGVQLYAARRAMIARLTCARDVAKRDAVKNLARYKFSMFGYHAARWVTLNAIIGDKQPNPFKAFVDLARKVQGDK